MDFIQLRNEFTTKHSSLDLKKRFPAQIFLGALYLFLILFILKYNLSHPVSLIGKIFSSVSLGVFFTSLAFFNHELLHGSILKSKWLSHVLAYPGFFIISNSPTAWKTWHNHVHHFHANKPSGFDPDMGGDWERLKHKKYGKLVLTLLPGSKHISSYFFLLIAFTVQAANVMWVRSKESPKLYKGLNRKIAVMETLFYYMSWIILFVYLPFSLFFYLFLIPLFITNALIIAFIAIQHNTRFLSVEHKPLLTTLSLDSSRLIRFLFFNISFHTEHHIFPEANHSYLPVISHFLKNNYPHDYCLVSHPVALKAFFTTPRAYYDHETLFNPFGSEDEKVDLKKLWSNV